MLPTEYLSEDILEEIYIKTFAPFHYVQFIFGTSRVDIRHNFATVPSVLQRISSIVWAIVVFVLLQFFRIHHLAIFNEFYGIYVLYTVTVTFYYILFIINLIHVRFINSKASQIFFVRLQKLDRFMNIHKNKKINRFLYESNVLTVMFTCIVFIAMLCSSTYYKKDSFEYGHLGLTYMTSIFLLEWLYCANILIYFFLRVRFINSIMANYLKLNENTKTTMLKAIHFPTKDLMAHLASLTHEFEADTVDVYYNVLFAGLARKKAKHILKILEESPLVFSVYDMWHMNAGTLINMINIVTSMAVAILQFALL
ncbi:unnamed protein product [Leptidea sinapis]|uniref:Gustatory receptor n=1 Tax=Leptidea sinapis TaxID=189913 RepID=A0A5E4QY20_9NEOP|nr:unnamed protein product [Leptidea sinapis]